MPLRRIATVLLAVSVLVVSWLLGTGENQTQTAPESENAQQRSKKKPPGYRYSHYDHPTEEQHRTAEQFAWKAAKNLGVWTGVAASVAALFAVWTWVETKRQADTADLALVAVQRAYVEPTGVRFDPVKDASGNIAYWNAYLTIQDFGVTPTRFLRAFGTFLSFPRSITDDPEAGLWDIPMGPQFGKRLGPQEKLTFGPMHISKSDIAEAGPYESDPKDVTLFWGAAEYSDVFPGTLRHITKFCYRLIASEQAITADVDKWGFPEITKSPDVIPCAHHNCTDEECDYDYRVVPDPNTPRPAKPPDWLTPNGRHTDP